MKSPNTKHVVITHVVNPHQFYFKYTDDCINNEYSKFDYEIQLYGNALKAKKTHEKGYLAAHNELVIFFHTIFNKWIRGRVICVAQETILWCIDNGICEKCDTSQVLPLPAKFHEDFQLVQLGGLSLLPTEKILNVNTVEIETHLSTQWDEKMINNFKGIIKTSRKFIFAEEFEMMNHKFGLLAIDSANKKWINNILKEINNVANSSDFADADLSSYICAERLESQLYQSLLNDIPKTNDNHNISTKSVRGFLNKSDSEISSIKNLAVCEEFDDSVSQISHQSSDNTLDTGTKSSRSSIIHRYSKAVRSENQSATVSDSQNGSSGIGNSGGDCYDDFDDSASMALSTMATTLSSTATSASHINRNGNLEKFRDYNYECYLRACEIDSPNSLRYPLAATMDWIKSVRATESSGNTSETSNSSVNKKINLNGDSRSVQSPPKLNMTDTTSGEATVSRRSMLANITKKDPTSGSTNIINNSKSVSTHGIPAGFAKNCLDQFGGPSNKK